MDISSDDDGVTYDFNTNAAVPVPSTSTGITSNGQHFRVAQANVDSDDDASPENSPRAPEATDLMWVESNTWTQHYVDKPYHFPFNL